MKRETMKQANGEGRWKRFNRGRCEASCLCLLPVPSSPEPSLFVIFFLFYSKRNKKQLTKEIRIVEKGTEKSGG